MKSVAGKVAIVIGASKGIGAGIARALAAAGAAGVVKMSRAMILREIARIQCCFLVLSGAN